MATSVLARATSAFKNRVMIAANSSHPVQCLMQFRKPLGNWDCSIFAQSVGSDGDLRLWRTQYGDFWGRDNDAASIGNVVMEQLCGVYEHGPVRVRRGDIVIDLGAHLGVFVRRALDAGAAKVVAFEASEINAGCLRRTFREEIADGRVALVQSAAWSHEATLHFGGQGLCGQVQDEGVDVRAETIDGIVANLNLPSVDFIKTDIEGAEREALNGARGTLRRFAPRMAVSSYHLPDDPDVLSAAALAAQPQYLVAWDCGQKRMFCWAT
jgi:FkbM family methyltransferase